MIKRHAGWSAPMLFTRFEHAPLRHRILRHLKRWGIVYLLAALALRWFDANFRLGLNVTDSLPAHLFLIHRGEQPGRGDFAAFDWPGGGPYPAGVTFVKQIAGVPGDTVSRIDAEFFVNGRSMGIAKPFSRQGIPLEAGPTGLLPPDRYYLRAPHPDSLDSRYRLTGWVSQSQIIGRAHVLF
jgi:conjugal transfer pilin signal peptidase TrbI